MAEFKLLQNGGPDNCGWYHHSDKALEAFEKVDVMEETMRTLCLNSEHLKELPDIKDKLLEAATGKKHVDSETFQMVVKYMGMVIIALLMVLVFLLTGSHLGLIGPVHQ